MLNLKKTALAVIALGSTAAFAGTMGPVCSAVNVTVPCENTAWDLGGRALYLQPSASAVAGTKEITTNTGSVERGVNPSWGWGFQLEASYHYSTGNDFDLNWYHFRNGNSRTLEAPVNLGTVVSNTIFPVSNTSNTTGVNIETAYQSVNTAWDQVNMEFGQHVDFGENKYARLHAGMNYSRVAEGSTSATTGYSGGSRTSGFFDRNNTASAVYNGFGPRVGMDLGYDWGNGLSVYGNGALSVLAGSSKTSYNPINTDSSGTETATWYTYNVDRVVPELDAKLGFMYTYAMAQGDLSFDIGWLFASYLGALGSEGSTTGNHNNNFGVQGLYFGLKWVGNVA